MKAKFLVLVTACAAATVTTFAEETVYYWNATTKGSDGYYNWSNKANWLQADKTTPATDYPNSGDAKVVFASGLSVNAQVRPVAGKCGSIVWQNASTTLNQGTLTLVAGKPGLDLSGSNGSVSFYCVLSMDGTGEVIMNVTRDVEFQKDFVGQNAILVKRGSNRLTLANDYNRTFSAGGVRMENGSLAFGNLLAHSGANGFDIAFSGNTGTQTVKLNYSDLIVKSLVIHEVNGVTNTTHGFTTTGGYRIRHEGGSVAVASSDFSGTLGGNIGVVWKPYSADTEFIFRKAVHTTTGSLVVSNGAIRVTDHASFPAVPSVLVSGANSRLILEHADAMPSATITIEEGGKLSAPSSGVVYLAAVTVDGTPLADGIYKPVGAVGMGTEAAWLEGPGTVLIGQMEEGETANATWNGAGENNHATTLANWNGAESLPALTDGSALVDVTGGSTFVADVDAWIKGFTLTKQHFGISAASGKDLMIGTEGIVNTSHGNVTVGSADGRVTVSGEQTWDIKNGNLTIAGPIATFGHSPHWIKGNGGSMNVNAATPDWNCPLFITNLTVKFNATGALGENCLYPAYLYKAPTYADDITVKRDLWIAVDNTITCTAGHNLTFDGSVCSTNTKSISITANAGSTITFNKLLMSRNGGTMSGSGRIVFNDSVHFRDRPSMSGSVIVELHKGENHLSGNMGTFSGGTLRAMAPGVITKDSTRRQTTSSAGNSADGSAVNEINSKDNFILDLNGFDASLAQLAMHANLNKSGGHVTSATPATLSLQPSKSWWQNHNYNYGFNDYYNSNTANAYGYETADKGYWEGQVTLSYAAASGMVRSMMRTSSSSGCVEVVSGTLVFLRRARTSGETFDLKDGSANPYPRLTGDDGAWPNAKEVRVKGGILKLEHSKVFGRQVDMKLTGGKVQLEDGVKQKVHNLYLNGVAQKWKTYGSTSSNAQVKDDTYFSGSGVVSVVGEGQGAMLIVR